MSSFYGHLQDLALGLPDDVSTTTLAKQPTPVNEELFDMLTPLGSFHSKAAKGYISTRPKYAQVETDEANLLPLRLGRDSQSVTRQEKFIHKHTNRHLRLEVIIK